MNSIARSVPTCLEVRYVLRHQRKAPPYQTSAITYVGRVLDIPLNELPADFEVLDELLSKVEPRALGINPVTWANKKASFKTALIASGIVTSKEVRMNKMTYLPPDWAELERLATTKRQRCALSGMIRHCVRLGVNRADAGEAELKSYEAKMFEARRGDTVKTVRTTAVVWEEMRKEHPCLHDMKPLPVPPRRTNARLIPFSDFDPALLAEWDRVVKWALSVDITSDDVRNDPIGSSTLDRWSQYIRALVTAVVRTGTPIGQIRSLTDLFKIDNFDRAMTYQVDDVSGGKPTHHNFYMAHVAIGIASDYLKLDEQHLAKMRKILKDIPRPCLDMTEKNKQLTLKFDDPRVRNRFVTAPDRIWNQMWGATKPNKRRLAVAQAALAIQTLMNHPLRLENLSALEFDRHIFLRPGGTSTLFIPASEAKGGKSIEFDIPSALAERLVEYRDMIVPSVTRAPPRFLFDNGDGTQKHFTSVRYLLQAYFKKYVGFHMNPHAYRHLAAKLILDRDAGAHAVVKDLLGHKHLSTTINFYTGTDTKRAGRFHSNLIEQERERANTALVANNGRL